jgi:hypothetical protein
MLVPEASVVVDLLVDGGDRGAWAADRISSAGRLHARHFLDLEVALRCATGSHGGLTSCE